MFSRDSSRKRRLGSNYSAGSSGGGGSNSGSVAGDETGGGCGIGVSDSASSGLLGLDATGSELLSLTDEMTAAMEGGSRSIVFDEFDSGGGGGGSGGGSEVRDTVAESLYALIGELFDMRGVFRWLRRSLMAFVQITYGSSISRQIHVST